jgi:tetrahydromethanopterin S-methyltransferase subunit D
MDAARDLGIKASHYIIGAFTLITAMSYRGAIEGFIDEYFPDQSDAVSAKFIYAIILTVILMILIHMLPETTEEMIGRGKKNMTKRG